MTIHKNITRAEMATRLRQLRRDGDYMNYSINSDGCRNLSTRIGKGFRFFYVKP